MKKKILLGGLVIVAWAASVYGTWYIADSRQGKESKQSISAMNEVYFSAKEKDTEGAYKLTTPDFQSRYTQEEFNKIVSPITDPSNKEINFLFYDGSNDDVLQYDVMNGEKYVASVTLWAVNSDKGEKQVSDILVQQK